MKLKYTTIKIQFEILMTILFKLNKSKFTKIKQYLKLKTMY